MVSVTGKLFSEALILASTNPQFGKALFIELQAQNICGAFCVHSSEQRKTKVAKFPWFKSLKVTCLYYYNQFFG